MASLLRGLTQITHGLSKVQITHLMCNTKMMNLVFENNRTIYSQSCLYRARRGTRERKLKMLKKNKARKAAERIREQLKLMQLKKKQSIDDSRSKRINDATRPISTDDVYYSNMFKLRVFTFEDAIKAHREVCSPELYNHTNAPVHAYVELDMSTDKKTKFFEGFMNVVRVNYPYSHKEDRSVLAFCKLREQMDEALEAGASLAGGQEIITKVKRGKVTLPDFQFIIAHPNIMHELVAIRGLLRSKFPEVEKGTLGNDLPDMIKKIKAGIKYESKSDDFDPSYGWVDVRIGDLNMEIEQLQDNLVQLLIDVRIRGPKRTKATDTYRFMERCFIKTAIHDEKLLINMDDYIPLEEIFDSDDEDDDGNLASVSSK